MKLLTSISFEVINKVRITILESIDDLKKLSTYNEYKNYKNNFTTQFREGLYGKIKLDLNGDTIGPTYLIEDQTYYILIESNNIIDGHFFSNRFLNSIISFFPRNLFAIESKFTFNYLGEFKTKDFIGIWDFSSNDIQNLLITVTSRKIDFKNEYSHLVSSINDKIFDLTAKFGDIHKLPYTQSFETTNSSFLETLHIQNYIYDFLESLDFIMNSPYFNNLNEMNFVPLGTQKQIDHSHILATPQAYDWRRNGPLQTKFNGYTPININNIEKVKSFDNYPNRFVKFATNYFLEVLYEIKQSLNLINKKSTYDLIRLEEVSLWIDEFEYRINSAFFHSIGDLNFSPNTSQVLEKRTGYQKLNEIFNNLLTALKIDFESEINFTENYYSKPVSDLYESWCFLEVVDIISNLLGSNSTQSLIKVTNNRIKVNLKHGRESKISFTTDNKVIYIYYNFLYTSPDSYTEQYKPDITIEVIENRTIIRHHFDAKYKVKKNDSFKEEDIWKMHAYKDGINYSDSATILYPGNIVKLSIKSDNTSINAIPFNPGNVENRTTLINFIKSKLSLN